MTALLAQSKANDALFSAAESGTLKDVKEALKAGADVNARDEGGYTALMYAAAYNANPSVLNVLIDAGADESAKNCYGSRAIDLLELRSDESEFSKTDAYQQMRELLYVVTLGDLL